MADKPIKNEKENNRGQDRPREVPQTGGSVPATTDLELLPEPDLQLLSLADFYGGSQLSEPEQQQLPPNKDAKQTVVEKLLQFLEQNDCPDLLVRVGKREFNCQRTILICYTDYMSQFPDQHEVQLPVEKVTPVGFEIAYRWMVEREPVVEKEHIVELLAASTFLEVTDLVQQVWYCLDQMEEFYEADAFMVATAAERIPGFQHLEALMMQRISRFFLTLVATAEFVRLPASSVCALLDSDELAVNSEKEVFYAAVRWLDHDWPNRLQHVGAVMSAVRLAMLPGTFMSQLRQPLGDEEVDRVTETAEFKQALSEACFAQTLMYYSDESIPFSQVYRTFDMEPPVPRKFIYHDLCSYHKQDPNSPQDSFNYKQFLAYLRVLQTCHGAWNALVPRVLKHYKPC
ncbi:kelch-like protein 4 [Scaptodrosophila lebanonensis]|uniref:Kelch-like protein 4 n=1 Tax=Drosophila lebanonensis TaxID=7225 RepID=A0A6J2UIN6_DROLE|nr:kelch-like protein 4 [Scaptodrosophila lebanonensis]XP_030387364.1 kelch-like protein 4 [Scaptodrosophila lebanonensis]